MIWKPRRSMASPTPRFILALVLAGNVSAQEPILEATLLSPSGTNYTHFGQRVAAEDGVVVVTAPEDDQRGTNAGAAYVFEYDGVDWRLAAKLMASDADVEDHFGSAVTLNRGRIVVGLGTDGRRPSGRDQAVYVFGKVAGSWGETARVTPTDMLLRNDFGLQVSLVCNTLVVGAPTWGGSSQPGAIYVFDWVGDEWLQRQRLETPPAPPDATDLQHLGRRLDFDGETIVVSSVLSLPDAFACGWANTWVREGPDWRHEQSFIPSLPVTQNQLGYSVGVDGDWLALMDRDQENALPGGAKISLFRRTGGTWSIVEQVGSSSPDLWETYGDPLVLHHEIMLVGEQSHLIDGWPAGAMHAYGYDGAWSEIAMLDAGADNPSARFSIGLALDRQRLIVGARNEENADGSFGAAHVYRHSFPLPACVEPPEVSSRGATIPLRVSRRGPELELSFENLPRPACEYNIYRGTIGSWYSQVDWACNAAFDVVSGERRARVTDSGSASYYWVTASAECEGPAGSDWRLVARPDSVPACGP